MGMNLVNIGQRPYIRPDSRGKVKKREDEEKSAAQTGQQEQQSNQDSRQSKGLQYTEDRKPVYAPAYNQAQFVMPQKAAPVPNPVPSNLPQNEVQAKAQLNSAERENAAVQAAYAEKERSATINIAQILKDFRSTALAIGTPDNLQEEVEGYLALIDAQVRKDEPDTKIIRSNLKNAASILDKYISKTLSTPEKAVEKKVVENWVDALFLQKINFKYDENHVNKQFLVKFPENSAPQQNTPAGAKPPVQSGLSAGSAAQPTPTDAPAQNPDLPQDKELKSTFIQAKKLAFANDPKKAIQTFQDALGRARDIGDTETESKIFFEVGKIYDNHDYFAQALKSYNNAIEITGDLNVKTKAHFSMAQIYDETNNITPALDHYFHSVSFGGEAENLVAQSTALAKIGNIYTDMFEDSSLDYYNIAEGLALQTDNSKIKGYVSSSLADAYNKMGEPKQALQSYSTAITHYTDADSPAKIAENYMHAADIMYSFNNGAKVQSLLSKARNFAEQAEDNELAAKINRRISALQKS